MTPGAAAETTPTEPAPVFITVKPEAVGPLTTEAPTFSIVILTYARDEVVARLLKELENHLGARTDYEVILVDNNADAVDRGAWLTPFARAVWLQIGFNKGTIARNDGMAAARAPYIILVDDDCFVQTSDFLDQFAAAFDQDPRIGAVTTRKVLEETMAVRRDMIPHTRKDLDLFKPFLTFRIVGGVMAFRRTMFEQVGGFSAEFFYGLEEIEYAYRIVEAGWKVLYTPAIHSVELEHQGGRRPMSEVSTIRLTNKYIISYMHMPFPQILFNYLLFTPYTFVFYRGQTSVPKAIAAFMRWLGRSDRPRRRPIGPEARAYIRACGGVIWR